MKVKIKKLREDAVIPKYSKVGDAGLDLTAVWMKEKDEQDNITYGTGLAIKIPDGHVGLIFPRSSISRTTLALTNAVGVIDSGYTGEITFKFKHTPVEKTWFTRYNIGERIGQLIILPYPQIEFEEVDELPETERGGGGFGSTGK